MSRLLGAICLGLASMWLAVGLGLPLWRTWIPGDATDIAVLTCWGALLLTNTRHLRPPG